MRSNHYGLKIQNSKKGLRKALEDIERTVHLALQNTDMNPILMSGIVATLQLEIANATRTSSELVAFMRVVPCCDFSQDESVIDDK